MRRALYAFAVLLLLGAAGVWLAFNYVDVVVKVALEHYGPRVTGVEVKVGAVKISPRDGRGSLRAIELGSPPGFTAPRSARLGEVRVALDPSTIGSPVIVIHELVLESPQITYERAGNSTNLEAIQRRIDAYVKQAADAAAPREEGARAGKRRFIIERLAIRGGRVTMTNPGLRGQGIGFDLPEVQMRDVGRREGGLTGSEIASRVAATLQNRIAQRVIGSIELLRKGGVEGAVDALKGLLK